MNIDAGFPPQPIGKIMPTHNYHRSFTMKSHVPDNVRMFFHCLIAVVGFGYVFLSFFILVTRITPPYVFVFRRARRQYVKLILATG